MAIHETAHEAAGKTVNVKIGGEVVDGCAGKSGGHHVRNAFGSGEFAD